MLEATYIYRAKKRNSHVYWTSFDDLYRASRSEFGGKQAACGYACTLRKVIMTPKRVGRLIDPNKAYPPEDLQCHHVRLCLETQMQKRYELRDHWLHYSKRMASCLSTCMQWRGSAKH